MSLPKVESDPMAHIADCFKTAILRAGGRNVDAAEWSKVCAEILRYAGDGTFEVKPFADWPGCRS